MKPAIKSYSDTVETATDLFGMTYTEAGITIAKRLDYLGLSELDIVIYVNWASHNALTYTELALHLDTPREEIKWRMQNLRRIFPHLFSFGAGVSENVCMSNWEMNKISFDLEAFHGYERVKAKRVF